MGKFVIFILMLSALSSHADDSINNLLDSISSKENGEDSINGLLTSIEKAGQIDCQEMTFEEQAEHCLREVCGKPGEKASNLTAKNLNKFLAPNQINELKQMENKVGAIFDRRKKEAGSLIQELEKRSNKLKDTSNWSDIEYSSFSNVFWKYIEWERDSSLPLDQRSKMKLVNTDNLDPSIIEGIKEFGKNFNKAVYDDPIYAFKSDIMDFDELKDGIQKKALLFKNKLAANSSKVSFNFDQFNSKIQDATDADEVTKYFKEMDELAQNSGIQLVNTDSYCKEKCKAGVNQFLKKIDMKDTIERLKESLSFNEKEDAVARCKANFIKVNQQNKSDENFKEIWPKVKEGYMKNVLPRFSSHSQGLIRDYLDNGINFYFENPTSATFPDLSEMMQNTSANPNHSNVSNADLLAEMIDQNFQPDINIYTVDITVCDSSRSVHQIWDSYLPQESNLPFNAFTPTYLESSKDNVAVSPYSCEHDKEGAGIIAHELGHALSMVMRREGMSQSSRADYQKIRSCSSRSWKNPNKISEPYFPGDHQFSEEDAADVFSYMAINDNQTLYACGFVSVSDNQESYTNFEPIIYEDDSHSPDLVRVLRELEYKRTKSAPETCQAIMKKHKDKMGDKKCF